MTTQKNPRLRARCIVAGVGLLIAGSAARAANWTVVAGGGGTHSTIQSALNDPLVVDGDIILVGSGPWSGPGNVELNFNGKAVTVRPAMGAVNCRIDGGNAFRGVYFQNNEGPGSVFEGIDIWNGVGDDGGAIKIGNDCSPTIRDVTMLNNTAERGGAIAIFLDSSPTIDGCSMSQNLATTTNGGGAVYMLRASPSLVDTTIVNNSAPYGGGVRALLDSAPTFEGCVISHNSASINGGGLHINDSIATVTDCAIQLNDAAEDGGGLIAAYSSTVTVSGGVFSMNDAVEAGGAARIADSAVTFAGVAFESNSSGFRGGAIRVEDGATVSVNECDFSGNESGLGGGAMFASESVADVDGCAFESNSASTQGGALRYRDGASGSISTSQFEDNEAAWDGGAIAVSHEGSVEIESCYFASNTAGTRGGALGCSDEGDALVTACQFDENTAAESGGAIGSVYGGELAVTDSDFSGNEATDQWGGAIMAQLADGPVVISGGSFDSNRAPSAISGSGGAIASFNGPLEVSGASFAGNTAGQTGGAILSNIGQATIDECSFIGNDALAGGGAIMSVGLPGLTVEDSAFDANEASAGWSNGGAISCSEGLLRLRRSDFTASRASQGAAVATLAGSVRAKACEFIGNATWTGGIGGAVSHIGNVGDSATYASCLFVQNEVQFGEGGAMYLDYLDAALVHNCGFYGNRTTNAGNGGGAIYARLLDGLELANSVFSCNSTIDHGGAVRVDTVTAVRMVNCTLSRNEATDVASEGGGLHVTNSNADVDNCIFWENLDAAGNAYSAQIFLASGGLLVDHSCFTNPACPGPLGTNICADPLFTDPGGADDACGTADDDLSLQAGSPCIDMGLNPAVPLDALDVDNDGVFGEQIPLDYPMAARFVGSVDMGAYEHGGGGAGDPDINGDGVVDVLDLVELITQWGAGPGSPADLNGDGVVDVMDLVMLITAWG